MRWADSRGFKVSITDEQEGEGAGISSAALKIEGEYAYGYLKNERGVHRLVRISPFDAAGKRHTSFVAIDCTPEISNDINIEIPESEVDPDHPLRWKRRAECEQGGDRGNHEAQAIGHHYSLHSGAVTIAEPGAGLGTPEGQTLPD